VPESALETLVLGILALLISVAAGLLVASIAAWLYSAEGGARVGAGLWVLAGLIALIGYIAGSFGLMIAGAWIAGALLFGLFVAVFTGEI
jgi:hypothetical protein